MAAIKGLETAIRDLVAEEDEIERQRQEDQEERDLDAQEAMAKWAKWMFWATLATAAITFVGLVLLGGTLYYARITAEHTNAMLDEAKKVSITAEATLREAEKATTAAQESVAVTRDVGMKQVRAYLTIDRISLHAVRPGFICFRIVVENRGQFPAIGACAALQMVARVEVNDVEIPPPLIAGIVELGDIAAGGGVVKEIGLDHGSYGYHDHALRDGWLRIPVAYAGIYASDVFDREIFDFTMFNVDTDDTGLSALRDAPERRKIFTTWGGSRDVTDLYRELSNYHHQRRKHFKAHLKPTHGLRP